MLFLYFVAIGCPDLVAPKGGWVDRAGETIKVGCHGSDDVYELTCSETTWQGKYNKCTDGNCTKIKISSSNYFTLRFSEEIIHAFSSLAMYLKVWKG